MSATLLEDSALKLRPRVLEACLQLQEMTQGMQPGEKLPTILQLHDLLGMSVQTLHRAVQQLEARGVVRCVNGVGMFVAEERPGLTGNIGLIGFYPEEKYFGHVLRGVEKYTAQNDLNIMILGSCINLNIDLIRQVDGVLMCDIANSAQRLSKLPEDLPRVSMFIREDNLSNVIADDYGGARLATQHLMQRGHRRIACLMEKDVFEPRQRFAGYYDALREADIQIQSSWMRLTGAVYTEDDSLGYLHWGRENMRQWLSESWRESGCSAILAQNDTAAIGIMQVLQEARIRVPQDVSVIGFDGTELCDHVMPQLTSMKIPLAEIGYAAAELLSEQVQGRITDVRSIMLPLNLRERQSVGDAPLS